MIADEQGELEVQRAGGYDDGYRACPCFWGRTAGSLVQRFVAKTGSLSGWRVLDAGCGEGKNAVFLADQGAAVRATDVSSAAIANAIRAWGRPPTVSWEVADILSLSLVLGEFDAVIAYGLLHCMRDETHLRQAAARLKEVTRPGGFNVVCAFNSRAQDLSAHPGFIPTLISHEAYLALYSDWEIVEASDSDLHETHPHNGVPHSHSMTRLIARRPTDGTPGSLGC